MENIVILDTECSIKYKFENIVLTLEDEKNLTLETLIKKYRDSLGIGTNLESLVITTTDSVSPIELTENVVGGTQYVLEVNHDSKGGEY